MSLADIDECKENRNLCYDGICENTPGSFVCRCDVGFAVQERTGTPRCTGRILLKHFYFAWLYVKSAKTKVHHALFIFHLIAVNTIMCLSIGTPKIMNFPFVPNGKFIIFRCPKI